MRIKLRITELIEKLEYVKNLHGNLPVNVCVGGPQYDIREIGTTGKLSEVETTTIWLDISVKEILKNLGVN